MPVAMRTSRSSLLSDLDVGVIPDAPLGPLTWYGIGGRADLLVRPRTLDALSVLARRCHLSATPLRVLGSGANLLVADEGVDGVVVRLDEPGLVAVRFEAAADSRVRLIAPAGADMARTLMETARRGLGGLEAMSGIPASIGGAIRMNAGGAFGSISDSVETVGCIARTGQRLVYPREELRFGYRETNIRDPIIAHATFLLSPDDPTRLRERVKEIFRYKKSTQPLAEHSAGCAFRNPIDPVSGQRLSAGRLIDETGLKGLSVGGATVSTAHANFITVSPGTSSRDVLTLLAEIRRRVHTRTGIGLEEEITIWTRTAP